MEIRGFLASLSRPPRLGDLPTLVWMRLEEIFARHNPTGDNKRVAQELDNLYQLMWKNGGVRGHGWRKEVDRKVLANLPMPEEKRERLRREGWLEDP